MKHSHCILSILFLLAALCGLESLELGGGIISSDVSSAEQGLSKRTESVVYDSSPDLSGCEELLYGRENTSRVSGERAKRVNPTQAWRNGGNAQKASLHSNSPFQFRGRLLSAEPDSQTCLCLSVRYYVFALRHILC